MVMVKYHLVSNMGNEYNTASRDKQCMVTSDQLMIWGFIPKLALLYNCMV